MFVGPTNAKRTDMWLFTASSCKTMNTLIKVYNRELLRHREFKFSNYLHGDSSASCIKPLVLVPAIKLCKSSRKPGKTRSAAVFLAMYTRDGPTVAASYRKRCEECNITYYYSYSDRMYAFDLIYWMFYDHFSACSLLAKLGRWGWWWGWGWLERKARRH